jgi:predicted small secreted protein
MERFGIHRRAVGLVVVLVAGALTACAAAEGAGEEVSAAPEACVDADDATRSSVGGTPVWARFCPGPERATTPAEVPSEALTTHLDLLTGLAERAAEDDPVGWPCAALAGGRSYQVQIGYADGAVATITGRTDPDCTGWFGGSQEDELDGLGVEGGQGVGGPDGLGVYGLLMTAFGRQYADGFEEAPTAGPLVCPDDPGDPDSVSVDGASAALDTGWILGERSPMVMPLTAERGIVCTWPFGADAAEPTVRELTPEDAERVRIGLHAISGGMVDCEASPQPTHTAVVEDRTGTRRAVTIDDSICSTVVRSDRGGFGQGYGLDFAWLDR